MELKTLFIQDEEGRIVPGANCFLYYAGTSALVLGVKDATGAPLSNPFPSDIDGMIQFSAPDGLYDVRVVFEGYDRRMRVQFLDAVENIAIVTAASSAAEGSAARAEVAADSANATGRIYGSTALGIASGNEFFSVPSPESVEYLILYKNVAGVAVEQKRYPSSAVVQELQTVVDTVTNLSDLSNYDFILADDDKGRIAIAVTKDGKTDLGSTKDVGGKAALVPGLVAGTDKLKTQLSESEEFAQSGYAIIFSDGVNRIGAGFDLSGDFLIRGRSVHGRLVALETRPVTNPAIDKWVNGYSRIGCWGDSLTAGAGASSQSYPLVLGTLLGRPYLNGGVGGQNSQQIATRQGGYINLLTVTGNTIPASGPVDVTASTQAPITSQGGNNMVGTLFGIPGVLSATFSGTVRTSLTFTRTTPGAATIIDPASPFIPETAEHEFDVSVLWYGRNNFWTGRTDFDNAKAEVKAALAASIAFLKPLNKKFVVMGVLNDNKEAEWVGTEKYNAIMSLNEEIKALYPRNFIDIRRRLVRAYNPALPQDVIDFGHDVTPTSLLSDTLHLNVAGYALVANTVYNFITQKGW